VTWSYRDDENISPAGEFSRLRSYSGMPARPRFGNPALPEQATSPAISRTDWPMLFTALHVMQTRYSDKNSVRLSVCPSVCLSVRLSHACIVTKR